MIHKPALRLIPAMSDSVRMLLVGSQMENRLLAALEGDPRKGPRNARRRAEAHPDVIASEVRPEDLRGRGPEVCGAKLRLICGARAVRRVGFPLTVRV